MSKRRNSFERREGDAYYTPPAAVAPLLPHLRAARVRTFAEPCCGDGALVRVLEAAGLRCLYQDDIATGQDALALDSYSGADVGVTNPPYVRPLMHALIHHLSGIGPTWMLLELDWSATGQAEPFLPSCSDIVVVGRVRWIEGTKNTGMDNYGWFRFSAQHTGGPILHASECHQRARAAHADSVAPRIGHGAGFALLLGRLSAEGTSRSCRSCDVTVTLVRLAVRGQRRGGQSEPA